MVCPKTHKKGFEENRKLIWFLKFHPFIKGFSKLVEELNKSRGNYYKIIESFSLEKTFKMIEFNC